MIPLRILIMAWVFLNGLVATGLVGPVRPAVEAEYGLSHAQFGAVFAAGQILFNLGLLLAVAPALRRLHSALVVTAGLMLNVTGLATICLTHSLTGFAAGWAQIFAGVMVSSLANKISMDLWPHNRRRGVVLLHAFNSLGKVAGPLVVAITAGLTWRAGYGIAAAIYVGLALFFLSTARRSAAVLHAHDAREQPIVWAIFHRPVYWLAILPFGLIAGGEAAFATLVKLYFVGVRGLSPLQADMLLALHLTGLAGGRFVTALSRGRVSNATIIAICLVTGVAVVPAIWAPAPAVYVPAVFLLGLMFSATWPTYYAQVSQLFPLGDMLAYGAALGNALGIGLCVALSSVIADYSLPAAMVFGPAVLWLFGLLFFGTQLRRLPAAQTASAP
jgi:fucose permease